jgi:hypothetical protein
VVVESIAESSRSLRPTLDDRAAGREARVAADARACTSLSAPRILDGVPRVRQEWEGEVDSKVRAVSAVSGDGVGVHEGQRPARPCLVWSNR